MMHLKRTAHCGGRLKPFTGQLVFAHLAQVTGRPVNYVSAASIFMSQVPLNISKLCHMAFSKHRNSLICSRSTDCSTDLGGEVYCKIWPA